MNRAPKVPQKKDIDSDDFLNSGAKSNKKFKFNITLSTDADRRERIDPEGPYHVTDFAVAMGALCSNKTYDGKPAPRTGMVLTREVCNERELIVIDCAGRKNFARAGERECAIAPVIEPGDSCFSTIVVGGVEYLTHNGIICLYPRTYVGPEMCRELNMRFSMGGVLKTCGKVTSDGATMTSSLTTNWNTPFKHNLNLCFETANKEVYCLVRNAHCADKNSYFSDGTPVSENNEYWFRCESIRASRMKNGNIAFAEGIAVAQFETQDEFESQKFKRGTILDTNDFRIGKFLNDVLLMDIEDLTNLNTIGTVKAADGKRRVTLAVGARVKIKCEGREGIVKKLDQGVATLDVSGKPLRYRTEDLQIID